MSRELEVDAPNVKQLIAKLEAKFPGIGPLLESSAVAINGEVVNDAAYEPVPAGAEIYFVVKAAGGSQPSRRSSASFEIRDPSIVAP